MVMRVMRPRTTEVATTGTRSLWVLLAAIEVALTTSRSRSRAPETALSAMRTERPSMEAAAVSEVALMVLVFLTRSEKNGKTCD